MTERWRAGDVVAVHGGPDLVERFRAPIDRISRNGKVMIGYRVFGPDGVELCAGKYPMQLRPVEQSPAPSGQGR